MKFKKLNTFLFNDDLWNVLNESVLNKNLDQELLTIISTFNELCLRLLGM